MLKLTEFAELARKTEKRLTIIGQASFPLESGIPSIMFSDQPLPPELRDNIRWSGRRDFLAGKFAGTHLQTDELGRSFVELIFDGVQVGETIAEEGDWNPVIGRTKNGDLICLYEKTTSYPPPPVTHIRARTSQTNGATWGEEEVVQQGRIDGQPGTLIGEYTIWPIWYGDTYSVHSLLSYRQGHGWESNTCQAIFGGYEYCYAIYSDGTHAYALVGHDAPGSFGPIGASLTADLMRTANGKDWVYRGAATGIDVQAGTGFMGVFRGLFGGNRHVLVTQEDGAEAGYEGQYQTAFYSFDGLRWERLRTWPTVETTYDYPFHFAAYLLSGHEVHILQCYSRYGATYKVYHAWGEADGGPYTEFTLVGTQELDRPCFLRDGVGCAALGQGVYGVPTMIFAGAHTEGTWTSAPGYVDEAQPHWSLCIVGGKQLPEQTEMLARFRTAPSREDIEADTPDWYPLIEGQYFRNGGVVAAIPRLPWAQGEFTLRSYVNGLSPRLYVGELQNGDQLVDALVKRWGDWSQRLGDVRSDAQSATIELMAGAAQASYWPWETATVRIGYVPSGGCFHDVLWLFVGRVVGTAVTDDVLTLTIGDDAR